MAANYPDAVEKLVVWGCNAYVNDEDRRLMNTIKDPQCWSPKAREGFIKVYGENTFYQLWDRFVDAYCKIDDICTADLAKIQCPTFILHGDKDPLVAKEHPDYL